MASGIERNIVKEILKESTPKGIHPSEEFVMYYLKLLLVDPNWGITENLLSSRANVQELVKFIISELELKESVKMMTLKLQLYFTWSLDHISKLINNEVKLLNNRLAPIKEQIMLSKAHDTQQVEALKRCLVFYTVFKSGLGSPLQPEVYSEGLAAVVSIMNTDDIKSFAKSSRSVKSKQLHTIVKITTGIRLFNKYCQKGGAHIPNLFEIYKSSEKNLKDIIISNIQEALEHVKIRTTFLQHCYVLRENVSGKFLEYGAVPPKWGQEYLERIKDELIHYRQYELFLRKILKCLERVDIEVHKTERELQHIMGKVTVIVNERLAVPVSIIFPYFEQIYEYWTTLQTQVILMSKYTKILSNMRMYRKFMKIDKHLIEELTVLNAAVEGQKLFNVVHEEPEKFEFQTSIIDEKELDEMSSSEEIVSTVTNVHYKKESFIQQLETVHPEVKLYDMNALGNIENIDLQYLGFCCWTMVKSNGFLLPGNPMLGIVQYKDDYYVFSSYLALCEFASKPKDYLHRVLKLAREKPQLTNFLLLRDKLAEVSHIKTLVEDKVKVVRNTEKGTQCEDSYVIPPYKDKSFSWNIWELKKNTLNLAYLTQCKTTSSQTVKSHTTNCCKAQTTIHKEQETQTMLDKNTSAPRQFSFLYGLRGRRDDKQFVINLPSAVRT